MVLFSVCLSSSLPPDFLGRTEIRLAEIKKDQGSKGPITKRLLLHEVPTGEIVVRLDLQLFEEPWNLDGATADWTGPKRTCRRWWFGLDSLDGLDWTGQLDWSQIFISQRVHLSFLYPERKDQLAKGKMMPLLNIFKFKTKRNNLMNCQLEKGPSHTHKSQSGWKCV